MSADTPQSLTHRQHPNSTPNDTKKTDEKLTLEQELFHALRKARIRCPSVKEFDESYAFVNGVRSTLLHKQRKQQSHALDVVIDVAGGHGAVAALFLVLTSARHACVIDPAQVGQEGGGVAKVWAPFYHGQKQLRYRHECLRTALPNELQRLLMTQDDTNHSERDGRRLQILVVACHACQHLSEETMQIAYRYGVHCAVMPCCQTDLTPGAPWKATARN